MKYSFTLFFALYSLSLAAQTTVNRKIAQRWDEHNGSVWAGKDSVVYTYNSNGDEQERFIQNTPTNINQWSSFFRYTSTYDGQQNLKTRTAQQWVNNAWKNITKYTYDYNGSNLQTEVIYQTSNSSNTWVNTGRIENSYNGSLQTQSISYSWLSNSWEPQSKQDFLYNATNELTQHIFYTMVNSTWEGQERRQYQYAFGQVSSLIISVNDNNGNWLLTTRTLNAINGSVTPPRIVSSALQKRDLVNSAWADSLKSTYLYTNNLLTSLEKEKYNPTLSIWNGLSLSNYAYGANNLLEDEKNFVTNGVSTVWMNSSRRILTYNNNNLNDKIVHYVNDNNNGWAISGQDTYAYNSNDSLVYRLNEAYTNSNFEPRNQYFYYYQNVVVGLSDVNNLFESASLFPNPSTGKIKIKTNETISGMHEASVFTVSGQKVWSQLNTQPIQDCLFDLEALPNGHYIFQISASATGQTQQFKFVKK